MSTIIYEDKEIAAHGISKKPINKSGNVYIGRQHKGKHIEWIIKNECVDKCVCPDCGSKLTYEEDNKGYCKKCCKWWADFSKSVVTYAPCYKQDASIVRRRVKWLK